MNELYQKVFEEYLKRLETFGAELFPIIPLTFIQKRQLAMMAAMVATEIVQPSFSESAKDDPR